MKNQEAYQLVEPITIGMRKIGQDQEVYTIAEMSANHNQSFDNAVKIILAAKESGADAVKLQTYTPDTITIDCDNKCFQIGEGNLWQGQSLYELYKKAYTPWDWHPKLKKVADDIGIDLFSSPFDSSAVDFLEKMDVPAYKIASLEIIDIPLLKRIAKTGKPVILSCGMASLAEIEEAVHTLQINNCNHLILLKCTSAYPSPPEEMNLLTIPHLSDAFHVPVGLSDHTLGIAVPITAVVCGACVIEKHFCLSRSLPGPDSSFSLEPHEFKEMVAAIKTAKKALGRVSYEASAHEAANKAYRRSLFAVQDMKKGEFFSPDTIRSIRPGSGLHPRYYEYLLGTKARADIKRGTPLSWDLVEKI
ncbi:MAG: pseudaminic acid synthase [Desulfobacula sp.]|jgi:N-acetylneuraminate synthase